MEKLANIIRTKYASAEKESYQDVLYQHNLIDSFLAIKPIIDDVDHMFLLLNRDRQIVYSNKLFKEFSNEDNLLSLRIGEVLGCIHSTEEIGGCGTSESCRECGVVNAILNSQIKQNDVQECRITSGNNQVYDFKLWAKSIELENTEYTLVSITDISNEKRKKVLERLFFHDILNCTPEEMTEFSKLSLEISNTLIEELKAQRMLGLAEDSKLLVDITEFDPYSAIEETLNIYNNSILCENKKLRLVKADENIISIKTDKILLKRSLGNLTKNALEASVENGIVSLSIEEFDTTLVFSVHSEAYIPEDIQSQIFQRSFSTKGSGRGIGTYSVKLLTEKYLGGEVSFNSTKEFGTTFYISIPKEL
jgi:hypothetical protein